MYWAALKLLLWGSIALVAIWEVVSTTLNPSLFIVPKIILILTLLSIFGYAIGYWFRLKNDRDRNRWYRVFDVIHPIMLMFVIIALVQQSSYIIYFFLLFFSLNLIAHVFSAIDRGFSECWIRTLPNLIGLISVLIAAQLYSQSEPLLDSTLIVLPVGMLVSLVVWFIISKPEILGQRPTNIL